MRPWPALRRRSSVPESCSATPRRGPRSSFSPTAPPAAARAGAARSLRAALPTQTPSPVPRRAPSDPAPRPSTVPRRSTRWMWGSRRSQWPQRPYRHLPSSAAAAGSSRRPSGDSTATPGLLQTRISSTRIARVAWSIAGPASGARSSAPPNGYSTVSAPHTRGSPRFARDAAPRCSPKEPVAHSSRIPRCPSGSATACSQC